MIDPHFQSGDAVRYQGGRMNAQELIDTMESAASQAMAYAASQADKANAIHYVDQANIWRWCAAEVRKLEVKREG